MPFPHQPPLMSAVKARNLARLYKGFAVLLITGLVEARYYGRQGLTSRQYDSQAFPLFRLASPCLPLLPHAWDLRFLNCAIRQFCQNRPLHPIVLGIGW